MNMTTALRIARATGSRDAACVFVPNEDSIPTVAELCASEAAWENMEEAFPEADNVVVSALMSAWADAWIETATAIQAAHPAPIFEE